MHDEVLSSIVGKHDNGSAYISFDLIKLEERQQIIRNNKEQHSNKRKPERIIIGLLIPLQRNRNFKREYASIRSKEYLTWEQIPQSIPIVQQR